MSFFSSWIKAIFIIFFAFLLCSAFLRYKVKMDKTNCMSFMLSPHTCTGEHEPVCATNGHTYRNICILCSEKMLLRKNFEVAHFGVC
ncbi:sperm-associated acrosin inhibitor isoform X3 [Bos indicus]|uniref:Sperm-associated acrosin inhibitor isoform X3 n=1 Tax=Bos indicus TaxID=9915 RepID=A0ABM4SQ40_BOSIN|nr:PREDICTED: serine protease inhibitor Kazal-type 14 isoform X2 [Bos indicus]XP_024851016.1 sperm-associated acrosin inhibitor isoform X2 [Bos taurus]XP_061279916.1 serine protease inhibitor Kazal-type 14 isoform X2 [Bos javanicus]